MEQTDFDTLRSKLHETIIDVVGEEEAAPLLVSGWILIYEGIEEDEERSLTVLSSDATGDRDLSPWVGEGLLRHVAANYGMYDGSWVDTDDSEEYDDDES